MNETSMVNATEILVKPDHRTTFSALTQAEIVIVGAVGTVILLAVIAVILRIIMPRVRQKYAKERTIPRRPIVDEKSGNLLAPGTPSSGTSRSSSSRSLDWSEDASYKTKSTYYSQNSLYPGKPSSFSNLRQHPGLYSGNASPASYRSKTTEGLNEDLISMISQQSNALETLNLGEQYRSNWEKSHHVTDEEQGHSNLGYSSHSANSLSTAAERFDTYPFRNNTLIRSRSKNNLQVPTIVYPPQQTKL